MFKKLDKKGKIYVILAITFVLLLPGGTLAWLEWSSDINALIFGEGCAPEIVVLGGATINGANLRPTVNKENGLHKDVEANLENLCYNDTATMSLNLELEVFPEGLADSSFVWELYKVETDVVDEKEVETFLSNGNFQNKQQGDVIQLVDQQVITGNISKYRLYIYLDGNQGNPTSTQHQYFKFNLYGSGRDAIYKENTMKKFNLADNVSYFLLNNENLTKSKIESIEIKTFNDVPSAATYIDDISSLNDDSVRIYYETNPETELNKVYLASSNGIIKMNTNMNFMFSGLTNVEQLDLTHLDTSDVTSMIGCFYNSTGLTTLDVSSWDTSGVMIMNTSDGMFEGCTNLTSLDLSNFNTTNISSMIFMFSGCSNLETLIINFNTSNVTDMNCMFMNCYKLKSLDLSSFNTSNVTSMQSMFYNCNALEEINLTSFNTSNVANMPYMFLGCSSLKRLDLSNFDNSNVTSIQGMFSGCTSLKYLNVSNFSNAKLTSISGMFDGLSSVEEIVLTNFRTNTITNFSKLFKGCAKLKTIDVSGFNTANAEDISNMFDGCATLVDIDLSNFVTVSVTKMNRLFADCTNLKTVDVSSFNANAVTSIYQMFMNCSSIEEIDLHNFNTSNVSGNNMLSFCYQCTSLKKLDIHNFDFTNIDKNTGWTLIYKVPSDVEIIVNNCTQYNLFKTKIGSRDGLHTINNDTCTA